MHVGVLTHGTQLGRREDVERLDAEVVAERARVHAATACLRTTHYIAA